MRVIGKMINRRVMERKGSQMVHFIVGVLNQVRSMERVQ
jgi:hypothetical protein